MGVLPCYRADCERIMCDTYVDGVGYICDECINEFKNYLRVKKVQPQSEWELKNQLKTFMDTEKDSQEFVEGIDVDEFFRKYHRDYEE